MVKNPGWENRLPDDWISRFQSILEMAENITQNRQRVIDQITAMKLSGMPKKEAFLNIGGDLMASNMIARIPIFQLYLDEVYGEEESTS
jgi:hypothetical protein